MNVLLTKYGEKGFQIIKRANFEQFLILKAMNNVQLPVKFQIVFNYFSFIQLFYNKLTTTKKEYLNFLYVLLLI